MGMGRAIATIEVHHPWSLGACSAIMGYGIDKLEKLLRVSGKATAKGLDALARHGFDLRWKLSAPISRVPGSP
jgi:hypothetical protein